MHPTQVAKWDQRLVGRAVDLFHGGVEGDAVEEAALRYRLWGALEIGEVKG